MSWSASKSGVRNAGDLDEITTSPATLDEGEKEQLEIGKSAALSLIMSGAIGSGKSFTVSINGHSNPDHEPREGWATDEVNVRIRQES